MKKIFALAFAAIALSLSSCSNTTTEDLENEAAGVTRAKVVNGACTVRGELCDCVVNPQNYTPAIISDHSHCIKPDCRYYYEALKHGPMQHHVEEANANGFEGDHNGGHGESR